MGSAQPSHGLPSVEDPTVRDISTIPIFSTGKFDAGFATDRNYSVLNGGLGSYVGVGDGKIGARADVMPFTPEGQKVFAEAASKLSSTTTLYGGALGTFDSGELAGAALWGGMAKDFNKNFTGGVKVERSVERDLSGSESKPTTSVNFW